jgi:hypothetical protein
MPSPSRGAANHDALSIINKRSTVREFYSDELQLFDLCQDFPLLPVLRRSVSTCMTKGFVTQPYLMI